MKVAPLLLAATVTTTGACIAPELDASLEQQPVVGGQAESGYRAAGWLGVTEEGFEFPPVAGCGAALIGARTAITAGHCIALREPGTVFGFGYDVVGSAPVHRASQVVVHPLYNPDAPYPQRWQHDLAILILDEPITGVEPAAIAAPIADPGAIDPASCDASAIYVGYGRTTTGDVDVNTGYDSERKSASQCITEVDPVAFYTTGVGGGLCWGDSGGAVLDRESGAILGVLSDFDNAGFFCDIANEMVFTNLATHTDFICNTAPAAAPCCVADGACNSACAKDVDCGLVCAADGECVDGCGEGQDPDCAPADPACPDGQCESETASGCGCAAGGDRGAGALLVILAVLGWRRSTFRLADRAGR